ncbi:STN domain-containing protein [Bradyrhizobium sp. LHD-71]|uniref:STN domain-containing protein n=1 Tax=Bradyrhizobium sp. LHD-71 TaxID=3072141 RepID=UPI00280D136A|nr:STN domain-containing protein [Bradyrhizobium sp. LHD-71]MDQ8728074.1 STN domain-containing protein [Bradyrhizobium sp. LHD-71]
MVGLALLAMAIGFAAFANEDKTPLSPKLMFSIPAQPLVTALQAYSAVSGVHVLYESGVEIGLRSSAVQGEFTREAALNVLLGDNNLVPRYARADSVVLVNPLMASANDPPETLLGEADLALDTLHVNASRNGPDRNALTDYVGAIQQDVQQALRRAAKTGSGTYRVGVDLWVDQARTIRKAEIFRSTGDIGRDSAVSEVLQGLVIRQSAPARTPQPVRVMIVVRSL